MENIHLNPHNSSKVHRFNRNGDEMCHAFGCRKHKNLKNVFNGLFCSSHYRELSYIRTQLTFAKKLNFVEIENFWRQTEIEFRKFHDTGHMMYKLKIEKVYSNDFNYAI
jgi:hypothetical protein